MHPVPDREFRRCVSRYDGDHRWRSTAGISSYRSLRDIEAACVRFPPSFTTDSAARWRARHWPTPMRDWRIYDFAQVLIRIARPLYAREVALDQTLYALDSTTIDLCLSVPVGQSAGTRLL